MKRKEQTSLERAIKAYKNMTGHQKLAESFEAQLNKLVCELGPDEMKEYFEKTSESEE